MGEEAASLDRNRCWPSYSGRQAGSNTLAGMPGTRERPVPSALMTRRKEVRRQVHGIGRERHRRAVGRPRDADPRAEHVAVGLVKQRHPCSGVALDGGHVQTLRLVVQGELRAVRGHRERPHHRALRELRQPATVRVHGKDVTALVGSVAVRILPSGAHSRPPPFSAQSGFASRLETSTPRGRDVAPVGVHQADAPALVCRKSDPLAVRRPHRTPAGAPLRQVLLAASVGVHDPDVGRVGGVSYPPPSRRSGARPATRRGPPPTRRSSVSCLSPVPSVRTVKISLL